MMNFDKSPLPPKTPCGESAERTTDREITVDGQGHMQFATAAASGNVEIELPSLPGSPNRTERLHARDLGMHVIGKMESSMKRPDYLKFGATQSPVEVLEHYVAVAKGSNLMSPESISDMGRLAKEFRAEPEKDRGAYYKTMILPFLNGLTPKRR
jgi:hypothetical protein